MSVITTADETKEQLTQKLLEIDRLMGEAHDLAHKMIDPDTWGSDEWSKPFVDETINLIKFIQNTRFKLRFWKFFGPTRHG